jgi:putative copper export protein
VNIEFMSLRIIHIVSGSFWVGSALFMVLLFLPRLRRLTPDTRDKLMEEVVGLWSSVSGVAAVVTIAAGVTLALRLRWGHLDSFLSSGWGWAILIGFISAIASMALGGRFDSILRRIRSGDERRLDEAEKERLVNSMTGSLRLSTLFVVITAGSMASARFV